MISYFGFSWGFHALAMVSSHWISGYALWEPGLPDAWLLAWLQTPTSILTFGFWAPLVSGPLTWNVSYFQSCYLKKIFSPDHSYHFHLGEKLFFKLRAEQIKIPTDRILKKIFVKLFNLLMRKWAQRGLVDCLTVHRESWWMGQV